MVVSARGGHPDTVGVGGWMQYEELIPYFGADRSDGRAVMLSTDAGAHWTDMTGDAGGHSGGTFGDFQDIHPDIHAVEFAPSNPPILFVGSDGGMTRTRRPFVDVSPQCAVRQLTGVDLTNCPACLSGIPA